MKQILTITVLITSCFLFAYTVGQKEEKPVYIPASKQRIGDAAKGYEYLVTGDYLKSGIPFSFYKMAFKNDSNDLQRDGINKGLFYAFTAVKAKNGEQVIAPNCLQCHAQSFDGKVIIGLGNSFSDFTINRGGQAFLAEKILQNKTENSAKYEAAKNFIDAIKIVSPNLLVRTKGVNLADHLAAILVAHRDPATFKWSDSALLKIRQVPVTSDVPPWWLLKKKTGCFTMDLAGAILAGF